MQHMLLTKMSSNEDLTWIFFPFGIKLLDMPEICMCSVGDLRCTADWDTDQQVMGGLSERRLLTFADVGVEGNVS